MRAKQGWAVEASLLATSLASGLGALRLTSSPGAARLVLSVVATVVAGHLGVALMQRMGRFRPPAGVALASGFVLVALVTSWISVPSATVYGIPTARTVRALLHLFAQAGTLIRSHPTPLPPTPGVVLCLTCGAGLAAVAARALFGIVTARPRRSSVALVCLVPTFGLFAYSAVLSSYVDRVTGAIAYIAAATVFLVVADLPSRSSERAPAGTPSRPRLVALLRPGRDGPEDAPGRTGLSSGLTSAALAVVLALVLSPSLTGMRLDALPFRGAAGPGASGVSGAGEGSGGGGANSASPHGGIGVIDLIANLQGVLSSRSQQVMFNARSPFPTYWQVGTLSVFSGSEWTPDPATAQSTGQLPVGATSSSEADRLPVLPQPNTPSTYSTQLSLVGLEGRLLPVPPQTVSVSGPGTTLDPAIGTLFTGSPSNQSSVGLTYQAVAKTPPGSLSPTGAGSTTPTVTADELAPYLALPSSVPSIAVTLAQQIVQGANGPAAEAEALAKWFDSGLFRYTLDPPPTVPGEDPLTSFLFVYRAGFCQQFAGAYAVLARAVGLPTRLAVGFATGTPVGNANKKAQSNFGTTYRVTGADAHVWPEVYLGPRTGWVSFEPTPPAGNEPNPVGVIEGNQTSASIGAQPSTPTTQARPSRTAANRAATSGPARHADFWPYVAVGALCALFIGGLVSFAIFVRRISLASRLRIGRSRRLRRAEGADARVLLRLERALRGLRRAGLGRRPSETLEEHVARLRDREATAQLLAALEAYEKLTDLAEKASYAADHCTDQDAAEAALLCDKTISSLRPHRIPVGR